MSRGCLLSPNCLYNQNQLVKPIDNPKTKEISGDTHKRYVPQINIDNEENESGIYDKNSFMQSTQYKSYSSITRLLLEHLFKELSDVKVSYGIKLRKDDALALTLVSNYKKNIVTIWPNGQGIRVKVLNIVDKNCCSISDIDNHVTNAILEKYTDIA